jgi:hypothetical protein
VQPADGGAGDGSADAPADVGTDAAEGGTVCTPATGCFVLPAGWGVVAFGSSAAGTACPQGFAASGQDSDEAPLTPQSGACVCGACNVTASPSCVAGAITWSSAPSFFGNQCTQALPSLPNTKPGDCNDTTATKLQSQDFSVTPLGPTGGACDAPATSDTSKVAPAAHDRICPADTPASGGCNSAGECRPVLAAPFVGCILQPNDQSCPSGFPNKHALGNGVSFTCGSCGCDLTATCSDAQLMLYTSTACGGTQSSLVADGGCAAITSPLGLSVASYKYSATVHASCAAGAPPAPTNVAFVSQQTVCCP